MGFDDFLDAMGKGLDKTVEGLNVVDRYINPFHQEQTLTPEGERRAAEAEKKGEKQFQGLLAPSLEESMAGMHWLYSNAISQPLSTLALQAKTAGTGDWKNSYFSSDAWVKAWEAAEHISPGQAAMLEDEEAKRAINSPLVYYKPAESYLPAGFSQLPEVQQQELLKEAGMPAVGNRFIEQRRKDSAWYKYGTGALDFGVVMLLDPTYLALKGAGSAYQRTVTMRRPAAGWSHADIDRMMAKGNVRKLMEGIWENRHDPQLLNNTTMAQRSAMGPRFGAIASTLNDPEELSLFVRTGMGDVRAMEELRIRNAQAAERIDAQLSRLPALDLAHSRLGAMGKPGAQRLIEVEMERLNTAKNADMVLMQRYNEILEHADELDQLHASRWSIDRARTRTEAQAEYLAGPARGGPRAVTLRPGAGPVQFGRVGFGMTQAGARPYVPRTIETGLVKSTLWGAGDFFSGPVTLVRMIKEAHPNGYMHLDRIDNDSIRELRGYVARIPGIREETRRNIVNDYLRTTAEAERLGMLDDLGRMGAAKVAQRYGFEPEYGQELYRQHMKLRQGEIDNMKRYSAALRDPDAVAAGAPLHIDEFTAEGGKVALSPFTVTRLVNGHTFQNLDEMGKVLARHGSALKAIRASTGNVRDAVARSADYMTYLWKFTTLFRLGYIPRVLGDDVAGQIARLGAVSMAMRAGWGVRNLVSNGARWIAKPALQAREDVSRAGAAYADDEMKILLGEMRPLEGRLKALEQQLEIDLRTAFRRHQAAQAKLAGMDEASLASSVEGAKKLAALKTFTKQREQHLRQAEARLAAGPSPGKTAALAKMKDQHDFLLRYRDLASRAADDYAAQQVKVRQGDQPINIDGQVFPAAFGGKPGEYYHAQVSADESIGNMMNTNKAILQGNLERSFDHGAKPISAAQDPVEHLKAWTHAINNQIMQDPLEKMIVSGKIRTPEEAVEWMTKNAHGVAYRKRLPRMIDTEDIARSQFYEVEQYLHTPEIRMKAMEEGGVTPAWLDKAVPLIDRPDVHVGQVGSTQLRHASVADRVIQQWFKVAATIPANRMSRHPLFNQLYEGHLNTIVSSRKRQGSWTGTATVEDVEQIARSARNLALRDTRRLVFDIAHRSDAAAALRFVSPFFSATAESFQRWGRILADRPEIVGYAANWYNAPLRLGAMQDADGNAIREDGKSYDPVTGKWRMVPKADRYIVTRVPKWVAESPLGKAFNITEAGGKLALSQNSINMVTQGDPWFNPGVGPVVQIPVNEWVLDKPKQAELARELGILPYGPQGADGPLSRAAFLASPKTVRDFLTAWDTSDERYQSIKLQITQRAIYEHEELGKPMLSAQEIADRTRNYWLFSATSAFLQPMATQRKDPYQFFRDQYNNLRRNNPLTADDEYLRRYGESHFIFAQEVSKSQGIPPTMKAVDLTKKWGKLIEKNPELAPLVIGPDGSGPFSREAYAYELNNPLVPGGAEMMRSKMTADEALKENQKRLGWAKYTKKMNELTAKLHGAGFASFDDEGAEDFKDDKRAWTMLYSEPLYPDGSVNPYYNEEWSKDFFTMDVRKYDRLIPGLTALARSDLAKEPGRSDLRVLQQYLGGRQALLEELNARYESKRAELQARGLKGNAPKTLAAQDNADLRYQWAHFVDGLVESDTRFGDLYHRYLSRDLDIDAEAEVEAEAVEEG